METSEKGNEKLLVLQCQVGDRAAFEQLFEIYQGRLTYYVRRLIDDQAQAEDITQASWLQVYRKIGKLKNPESFSTWLYRIARNEVYRRFRRMKKELELNEQQLPADTVEPEDDFAAVAAEKVHAGLEKLKPAYREVLTLYFLENMSYKQIAEVVGCNLGTIRSRIFNAKAALRKLIGGIDHE